MDTLSDNIEYDKHIYIPYRIEELQEKKYMVFYLEKGNNLHFLKKKSWSMEHEYRGSINWNKKSYLFYEITQQEQEFLPSEHESLWKVSPYEILYTRMVMDVPIHPECISFFKSYLHLCLVEDFEVPVIAYVGLGVSELKEQILLQSINEKQGPLGKGYYFYNYEDALRHAYHKEETDDFLIRLENKHQLTEQEIRDNRIDIKDGVFYHDSHDLGDVPSCSVKIKYFIYYYDKEVIYLKSKKPNECQKIVQLRNEPGYVMRYILFLNHHRMGAVKGEFDSYAYDSMYMIHNPDDFICLSYHFIKKK